jgi:hypothetical protein
MPQAKMQCTNTYTKKYYNRACFPIGYEHSQLRESSGCCSVTAEQAVEVLRTEGLYLLRYALSRTNAITRSGWGEGLSYDIWGSEDSLQFAVQEVSGPITIL